MAAAPLILLPFLGAGVGGSHIATFELARALHTVVGATCIILCSRYSMIAAEALRYGIQSAFTNERTGMRHSPFYDLGQLPARLAKLAGFRRQRPIVHCNDVGALQSWGPPAKLLGMPVVYHHHSLNRDVLPNRMTFGVADAIVAVSDVCRDNLHFAPAERISVALNPFSLAPMNVIVERRRVLEQIDAPADSPLFGFIGNLWHRKRPQFFLESARHILAREPRAHFLVYGREGELTLEDVKSHAESLGIGPRVHMMGFRAPAEANIAALDVLMAPGLREPFGRTLVESILLGVPYVATDDAGHSEIHRRWGGGQLMHKDASAEMFAEAALALAVNPVALPLHRRNEIAEEVSANAHAEHILDVYRKIAPHAPIPLHAGRAANDGEGLIQARHRA
ncbi:MAG: glycosyltransferase family 4 protein [Hyphomonadaceae bacterium]|nr:glycosyltransferase family 4 protein [Hyphomonadaceae bacterium]